MDIELSIIIPIYNEEDNIEPLYAELHDVLEKFGKSYEIIFINDGSFDESLKILKSICSHDERVKTIDFVRNFGQTATIQAGIDHAKGRVIVAMDGDLQNDPKDILLLFKKIKEGYGVVSGWRKNRKDPFISKRLPSHFSNWIASKLTGLKLHDYGCTLKAYKKDAIKNLHLYGEMHRYIPALVSWLGASVTEIEVNHRPRKFGKSKYGTSRILNGILDLITVKFFLSYLTRPIQIFGRWGILCIVLAFLSGVALVLMKLLAGFDMTGNPLLILTAMFFIVGVLFIVLGLLGEITVRTYYESQNKPTYIIKDKLFISDKG